MFEVATLNPNHTLQLSVEIAKQFQPSDRFLAWMEDETLYLKRMRPSPLKAVEQAPANEPLSLDEINDLVQQVRHHRKVE